MKDFKGKYRTESNRLKGYNYSQEGLYFVTIVVQNRERLFGKIIDEKMVFSEFGNIANEEWIESFKIRKELFCDEYIVMPNHLHAIVGIRIVETHGRASQQEECRASQQEECRASQQEECGASQQEECGASQQEVDSNIFYRKPKSISSFIAGYKSKVTIKIDDYIDKHNLSIDKYDRNNRLWQPNYFDRVIRDEKEYWKMKTYIRYNPRNWEDDDLY